MLAIYTPRGIWYCLVDTRSPLEENLKIVIIGGVAAGMSAAARARRLDEKAEIIVLERGPLVSFANCGLPYFIGGEITERQALSVQTPQSLWSSLRLDVRTNHDVVGLDRSTQQVAVNTPTGLITIGYDALILAPGARTVLPPIVGLDSPRVTTLRTVEDAVTMRERMASGARRAVVLGAGFIGIEAADALVKAGIEVSLVEAAPHVLMPIETELAGLAEAELQRLGVHVYTGVGASHIENGPDVDTVMLSDGRSLQADFIVAAVGVRPDTKIFEDAGIVCLSGAIIVDRHGHTNDPQIWAAGDATASLDAVTATLRPVALAGPANRAGRQVADAILRPETAREIPTTVGTGIVRVGQLTIAMTGANRIALEAAKIVYQTVHAHPAHHAGYFPGAQQMSLVVHFECGSGRLLGAQAIGRAGVDKRIDVLASAIRAKASISDLIDLDLAYSPPYGSAKDPINMLGMVGDNVQTGQLKLWQANEAAGLVASGEALILDVRSSSEFASGHLSGALNIAHTELRDRLVEVTQAAAGRPVRVMCASGVRSYIAHCILSDAGFDSASLSGGMLTLDAGLSEQEQESLLGTGD